MLLFPAMSFVQAGRLSSLEFVIQELSSEVHIRFQTYRPLCHNLGQHLLLPSELYTATHKHTLDTYKCAHILWEYQLVL